MNVIITIILLVISYFTGYMYLVMRDIEKDRRLEKEYQKYQNEEFFKHLEDVKVLKKKPKKYGVKEIKK